MSETEIFGLLPSDNGVLLRNRLFDRLDARSPGSTLWIHAPAGAGKTVLVTSYLNQRGTRHLRYPLNLADRDPAAFCCRFGEAVAANYAGKRKRLLHLTPEYFPDLPRFLHRYVRQLLDGLPDDFTLVIDNFQELPADSPITTLVVELSATLPRTMGLFIVSREEPPVPFWPYRVDGRLEVLGWQQLRLDDREAAAYLHGRLGFDLPPQAVRGIMEKTEGWFAGVVLLAEHFRLSGQNVLDELAATPTEIFDYFAALVLRAGDPREERFLLETALLSRLTVDMAMELTGDPDAGERLDSLARRNFFTLREIDKEIWYSYHPLFRQFLNYRGRARLAPDELAGLKLRTAGIALAKGELDEAVRLYGDLEEWSAIAAILADNGQRLLTQGQSETVRGWLKRLPPATKSTSGPLSYWEALAVMADDPLVARKLFLLAADRYAAAGDRAGQLEALACAGDMSLQALEFVALEEWLDQMSVLLAEPLVLPDPRVAYHVTISIFHACSVRRPDHPEMARWRSGAMALQEEQGEVDANLLTRALINIATDRVWQGDFVQAGLVVGRLRRLKSSPQLSELHQIMATNMTAIHAMFVDPDALPGLVERGIEEAEEAGIGFWNVHLLSTAAVAALSAGDVAGATAVIKRMTNFLHERSRFDGAILHLVTAWNLLLQGNPILAARHQEEAVRLVRNIGWTLIEPVFLLGLAIAAGLAGNRVTAWDWLDEAEEATGRSGSRLSRLMCLLVAAELRFDANRDGEGLEQLGAALALWRDIGCINLIWWRPAVMAGLLNRALIAGLEIDFVRSIIRKRRLIPVHPFLAAATWPWPIRIHTLGNFTIELDGRPLIFRGKVQKKPLELLKVLIARGGANVPSRSVCDILWPDADDEAGATALATTLFRLRQLLGDDQAVLGTDGLLTLNPQTVWIDIRAFEGLIGTARAAWGAGRQEEAASMTERALALYQGDFLPAERELSWSYAMRERLRSRFARKATRLCGYWEQSGDLHRALGCFQDAIALNPLVEEFYQHLMRCQVQAGQRTEALKTYERCRRTLAIELDVALSPATEELYRAILDPSQR